MKRLANYHNKHLKQVYGDGIFEDKHFHMNYGWSTTDNSFTTKIYKKDGHEFLTTYFNGKYAFENGKL